MATNASTISVKGFGDSLTKLNGTYSKSVMSGGRSTYKKQDRTCTASIYFWDKDDGMQGWWIAPKINGDEVWARHPSKATIPPRNGWHAPWEAKQPNKEISLTFGAATETSPVSNTNGVKRPVPISSVNPAAKRPATNTGSTPTQSKPNVPGKPNIPARPAKKTEEEIKEIFTKAQESLVEHEKVAPTVSENVDKLKDVAVMFTCEIVDHMDPDAVLEMKKNADTIGKESKDEITKTRKAIDQVRQQVMQCHSLGTQCQEMKTKIETLNKKLTEFGRIIDKNLGDVNKGSQKAVRAKQLQKQQEAQKVQRLAAQKVTAYQIIARPMKEKINEMKSVKEIRDAESLILAMTEAIAKETPLCQGSASHVLRSAGSSLKSLLHALQNKRKDINLAETAKVDELGTLVATGIQKFMEKEKLDEDALFAKVALTESLLTNAHLEQFAKDLELGELYTKDLLSTLYGRALIAASIGLETQKESLTKEDFFMYVGRALYSTRADAVMESIPSEEGETPKKIKVEGGDIVEVIEGPSGEPLKVKGKLMDGQIGHMPFTALQHMSPQFSVMQETVLTDRHELKGFAVVQRLKPGMKLRCTQVPAVDNTTKLLRVPVVVTVEEKELSGYVTVKGNRGAQLLKQEGAAPADFGESPVTAREVTDEDWKEMVQGQLKEVTDSLTAGLDEILGLKDDCEKKCATLEALADGWTEEVLVETSEAAVSAWEKIDKLIQTLANSLVTQSKELHHVNPEVEGPLSEVKKTVDDVQKRLLEAKAEHAESTKRARLVNKKTMGELKAQNREKDFAKEDAFVTERINAALGRKEQVVGMIGKLNEEPDNEQGVVKLSETIEEAREMVTTMREWNDETRKECQGKVAKKQEFGRGIGDLTANISRLNSLILARKTQLTSLWANIVDKACILVSKALREHMEMNKITEDKLFAQSATNGALKLSTLQDLLLKQLKMDLSVNLIERVFKKSSPKGSDEMNEHQFSFLTTCYYKVVKNTTITDSLSIKGGNRLVNLKADDSVRVLGPEETDESTGVARMRVAFEDKEGYVTVKGNQGTLFLAPQSFYYRVTKDTVITNKFEMENFTVVRRLKVGDVLRARSLPKEETQSGLWRLDVVAIMASEEAKATTIAENSGFVTMKGNQGTAFLDSVNIEGMDLEEPGETATIVKKVEEKVEETPDVVMET